MEKENPMEKVNAWIKNSIMLKLTTIAILMLLLLIPTSMIRSIINERQYLNDQAVEEVSSKWAEQQEVAGPVLTIPVVYEYGNTDKGNPIQETKNWHILPESLDISGVIDPEQLRRGIYEIVVYESQLDFEGTFKVPVIDSTNLKEIRFDKAFLTIGISDLRGIKNQVKVEWLDNDLSVQPGSKIPQIIYSGITVALPDLQALPTDPVQFRFSMNLQGSKDLAFVPVGSSTKVNLKSAWDAPSFNGNFLPDNREVSEEGFSADWSVLQLNRNYPQSWFGSLKLKNKAISANSPPVDYQSSSIFGDSAFGVELLLPLDDYQKSMRSAKYAVMTISLTFLIFFLVEILNKKKIHPFQYILVGLSLCLFYTLLVSISEHSNFNFAYGISTVGIVSMISLYTLSIFKMKRLTYLLSVTLIGIYGFLFVTLQLSDYALLMGSIGLFLILGLTMYFTRNINWYRLNIETTS